MNENEFFSMMIDAIEYRVGILNDERIECEKVITLSDKMIKFQKRVPLLLFICGTAITGIAQGYNLLASMVSGGVKGLVISVPVMLVTFGYFGIAKKHYNKKIKKIDMTIDSNLEAKKILLQEIEKMKEREIDASLDKGFSFAIVYEQDLEKKKKKGKKLTLRKKK